MFEPKPGPTETSSDANSAEKYKISVCGCLFLYHCNAVIYVSKRGRLRDTQPDWLSLTPLIWTAEAVEPRLGRMMKLPLYLAHTSLPTAGSMSHPPLLFTQNKSRADRYRCIYVGLLINIVTLPITSARSHPFEIFRAKRLFGVWVFYNSALIRPQMENPTACPSIIYSLCLLLNQAPIGTITAK